MNNTLPHVDQTLMGSGRITPHSVLDLTNRCADVRVNLRRFSEPLFSCEAVSATAVTMGAWVKAPPELFDQTCVILDQSAAGKAPRNIVSPAALERVSCGLEDACTDRRCAVDRVILVKRSLPPKVCGLLGDDYPP